MKSKKRHHQSSDDSEESDPSVKSSSSSNSDSDDSSVSAPRHKKKRKRVDSSNSESNSDDHKRAKKRKHKKKKKKHNKKKRRSESYDDVSDDVISISEGEISPKKKIKHKHKHSKETQSESTDEKYERPSERPLQSVVKERRPSLEGNQPVRTYYQKEYHHSDPRVEYEYDRGAHKYYQEPKRSQLEHQESYNYAQGRNDRFPQQDDKYNRQREKYGQHPYNTNQDYRKQPEYDEYKRPTRYEEHRGEEVHYKQNREMPYQVREETRGDNRHNRYEDRGFKRREYDNGRDFRDRRGPAEPEHYRDKEYEKRERLSPDSDISTDNYNDFGQNMSQLQRHFNVFTLKANYSRHV